MFSKFRLVALVSALVTAAVAQPLLAHDAGPSLVVNQVRVHYGDLNIQSALGAESLVTRIALAAKQACGGQPALLGPGSRIAMQSYVDCRQNAEKSAVSKINQSSVTAAYARVLLRGSERMAAR
jgi:UrcA family protein